MMKTGRLESAFKTVKTFFGDRKIVSCVLINKENDKLLFEEEQMAKRWKEYLDCFTTMIPVRT